MNKCRCPCVQCWNELSGQQEKAFDKCLDCQIDIVRGNPSHQDYLSSLDPGLHLIITQIYRKNIIKAGRESDL